MRFHNERGEIQISSEVFTTITGAVATSCFGVKGMAARSKKDGLVHLLRNESMAKGVRVIFVGNMTGAKVRAVDVYVDSMQID